MHLIFYEIKIVDIFSACTRAPSWFSQSPHITENKHICVLSYKRGFTSVCNCNFWKCYYFYDSCSFLAPFCKRTLIKQQTQWRGCNLRLRQKRTPEKKESKTAPSFLVSIKHEARMKKKTTVKLINAFRAMHS